MSKKRILYISGSLGLGHITRDLAIAEELRRHIPGVELSWLAAHPASIVLKEEGENLLPEAELYTDDNKAAEDAAKEGFRLNLLKYLSNAMGEWKQNVKIFKQVITKECFDVVVADEAYEISIALEKGHVQTGSAFVMIYDFFGNVSMGWNPVGRLMTYMWNREWAKCRSFYSNEKFTALFVGELEDVPDRSLGFLLPNARNVAQEVCNFMGYVLPFKPAEYANKSAIRTELGYSEQPLIIWSIGGTSVGRDLLLLCGQAYPIIRDRIPNLQMVIVCGPRLPAKSLDLPEGIEVKEYVPQLYRHFAASDLAIVQAGGTTTIELTALRRPFLYFPLEGHFEQQIHVSERLVRHKAGIRMSYKGTTPDDLAKAVISNFRKEVNYPEIPTDGAKKAAALISKLL
jgi:UDP:flavonoid glycosyltransferase YjiC (YdhE family)